MKKLFTLFFVLFSFSAFAQIDFNKDSAFAHASASDFEIPAKAQLTNNSNDTSFRIIRTRVINCEYQETAFCDQRLCYPSDQDTAVVTIAKDESFEFKMNFYPFGASGKCAVMIKVESVNNPGTNVDSCYFQASNLVSVDEISKVETKVYPNPAKTKIQLETPNKGAFTVVIYDILGNQVLRVNETYNNQEINVEDLPAGIYVLKVNGEVNSSTMFRKF